MQTTAHPATSPKRSFENLPRIDGVIPMYVGGEWRLAKRRRDARAGRSGERARRSRPSPKRARPTRKPRLPPRAEPSTKVRGARSSAAERAALLLKVADAIDAHRDEFMRIDTLNNGKPLRETEYDAIDAANCFRYYAGLATKPHGQTFDVPAPSQTFTVREPIGVCGQIVPWNYPLLMAAWKLAPALAAGNVCVLKPSELTPLSAMRLARHVRRARVSARRRQHRCSGRARRSATRSRPARSSIRVAFTGGTKTGRSIMQAATANLKKISLELGGKSPNVVFADADFDTAIDYALFGIFANAGQVCSAGSRLLLERSLHDRFVERLVERAQKIRVGDGFDPKTEMGPIISPVHRERVEAYIAAGRRGGREAALRRRPARRRARRRKLRRADHLRPRRRRRCASCARRSSGRCSSCRPSTTKPRRSRLANDTIYGLAGAVFTHDVAKAHRVIRKLRAGITWINTYHPTYNEAPWGGYKQSGIGRELGTYGYDAYTEVKQINVNLDVEPSGWFENR